MEKKQTQSTNIGRFQCTILETQPTVFSLAETLYDNVSSCIELYCGVLRDVLYRQVLEYPAPLEGNIDGTLREKFYNH